MPHVTDLGLWEFQRMMVPDAVVMKISSHEYVVAKIESRVDVVMKKLVANRCGREIFPNKIAGNFLATQNGWGKFTVG